MLDPLAFLRAETTTSHQSLEAQGRFAKIMQPNITLADYQSLLTLLYRFYAGIEPILSLALATQPFRPIYRPRLALIAADLSSLDCQLPTPCNVNLPIDTPAQMLGVIYVIEGSALGGQVICRHLQKTLGDGLNNSLAFYTTIGTSAGLHWKNVGTLLRQELDTPAKQEEAAQTANLTFAALFKLALAEVIPTPTIQLA